MNELLVSSSAGSIPLFYDYASTAPLSGGHLTSTPGGLKGLENYTSVNSRNLLSGAVPFTANAITIEVTDRLPVLTEGFNYNLAAEYFENQGAPPGWPEGAGFFGMTVGQRTNIGGVFITLPTAEIYIQSLGFTVAYTGDVYAHSILTSIVYEDGYTWTFPASHPPLYLGPMAALTSRAFNDNGAMLGGFSSTAVNYPLQGDFGSIFMRGITFTQLSGWMEIAPH